MDRRAVFFLLSAIAVIALAPVVPDDPKHPMVTDVAPLLAIAFVVLAVLSWLDHWSRRRSHD